MKMRIHLAVIFSVVVFGGCATVEGYKVVLDTWVGASEENLIRSWGAPDSVYNSPDGTKRLIYSRTGGSSTEFIGGQAFTTHYACRTEFEVTHRGVVTSWLFRGNSCTSKPPENIEIKPYGEIVASYKMRTKNNIISPGDQVVWATLLCGDPACDSKLNPRHIGIFPVNTPNEVDINARYTRKNLEWTTIYIDKDHSGNLTPGDLVWGSNPQEVFGQFVGPRKVDHKSTTEVFWDAWPYTVYQGDPQKY